MNKEIMLKIKMQNREEVVKFLKSLWAEKPQSCPKCGGKLDYFHKKAKKSNSDWICTRCFERYNAIKIFYQLDEKQQ